MKEQTTPISLTFVNKYDRNRFCKFCLKQRLNFSIEALIKRAFIGRVQMSAKHQEAFNELFNPSEYGQ